MMARFVAERSIVGFLLITSLGLLGCGSDGLPLQPVRGQLTCDGQPCVNALVVFHPVQETEEMQGLRPYGRVQPDGSFTLTTYDGGDGAPAGDYIVTVSWPAPLPGASPTDEDPEIAMGGPDQLQKRYNAPESSTLKASVVAGDNHPQLQVEKPK